MAGVLTRFVTAPIARHRLPRWAGVGLGVLCVLVGAVLTVRPFTSLGVLVALIAVCAIVTGVGELAAAADAPAPRLQRLSGVAWIITGVAVVAWAGLTITGITVWVGIALVVSGVLRILGGLLGAPATLDARITDVVAGVAGLVLGVLALAWPDVTVLVVAVVFGVRTVLFGLTLIWSALPFRAAASAEPAPAGAARPAAPVSGLRRFTRLLGAVAALVVALALGSVSVALHKGAPSVDAFYDPPASMPSSPGVLIRSEPFTRAIPPTARAWRILYTTTATDGSPALASGIVLVSKTAPPGPRPVIAWAHGTTGFARNCAPSLLKDPLGAGALPALNQIISNGWILVATDYTGLGTSGVHPYLIGPGEAHSVLDAVRAAKHLDQLDVADKTVVWGHSQGGNAALWSGQLAPTYAPDDHVVGVAALAPASDLKALAGNLNTVPGGAIFASYIVAAYTGTYRDVRFEDYIRPAARAIVRADSQRCLAEPEVFVSIASSLLADKPIFSRTPTDGALGDRLAENTPTGVIAAPVFIGQGLTDPLVLPSVQKAYAERRCALGGGPLEYKTYPGRDHTGVVAPDSALIPDLINWTRARINGRPAPSTC